MNYVILIVLGAIMFFTPYQRGLFFDVDVYLPAFVIMVCFMAWMIGSMLTKKKESVTGLYFVIFLIPIMFVLAFISAESPAYNFDNLFRWLAYACFFVLLVELRKSEQLDRWIPRIFQIVGIAVALFSYFGYLGWIDYRDIIVSDRLSGPFQYPNTFAAVMAAYWLYALVMTTVQRTGSIWSRISYSGASVLFLASFLLAFSRGALLVLPIAWFIGLLLMRTKQQMRYLLNTVLSGVLALVVMVVSDGNAVLALFVLLVSSAISVIVNEWLSRRGGSESKQSETSESGIRKYGRWITPSVVLVIGLLLVLDLFNQGLVYRVLPTSIQEQVSTISLETGSAIGRMGMYDDALAISADYPLLGAGGEGWRVLYGQYQTEPYLSNEIHNGYLEMILNIGYVGFVVFLLVFGLIAYAMFRERANQHESSERKLQVSAGIIASAMLFMHAFLDFNFSYGTFWFIILWLLAMSVPTEGIGSSDKIADKLGKRGLRIAKSALVLFVLVGSVFSVRVYAASLQVKVDSDMSVEEVVERFEAAVRWNPYNTTYGLNLANIYAQHYAYTNDSAMKQKAEEAIERVIQLEPNNAKTLFAAGEMHLRWNDWDRAISYMDEAIRKEPFEVRYYNSTIPLKQQLGAIHAAQDAEASKRYYDMAVADYESYLSWYEEFKDVGMPDKRNIVITKDAHLAAARAYVQVGMADRAIEVVGPYQPVIDEGIVDPETQQVLVDELEIMSLSEAINQYKQQVMILSVRGTATRRLPDDAKQSLLAMGSNIDHLQENGSYIAIVSGGELLEELINNEGDSTLSNEQANARVKELLGALRVSIFSGGGESGNTSSINVDGVEYSMNKRGFNIAVFDEQFTPIGTTYFDTHVSDIRIMK